MRVLLDTNVLVSAFATRGLCADVLRVVVAEHRLVVGVVIIDEVRRVLHSKLKVPEGLVHEIESFLCAHEVVAKPKRRLAIDIADPDDAWIFATAVLGKAEVIVTGDRDLLDLGRTSPIRVLSPRGFWTEASGGKS